MAADTSNREIISTRIINHPQEKVFNAWTNPDQLKNWWGPNGFTNTFHQFSATPGGQWNYTMHGPDVHNYENESVFEEINAPEQVVIYHTSKPEFHLIGTFEAVDDQHTKITFHQIFNEASVYEAVKHICIPANEENLDRLEKVLEG
ncbi:SRPBCC family protein [Mucilaginibacter jinjuensis]|uniref:SRPBCC family protein n=1 Tax=Mucilaginibacter jinjuensis TaxID=1176721 RepID=A0ABY7T0Z2_9SPHI|nr:SRPBCC family protein [Mucilaginibacter jinjuensis]WCT09850.1 SRPBCC family protein [Mucilaginibacter jinjuensis]